MRRTAHRLRMAARRAERARYFPVNTLAVKSRPRVRSSPANPIGLDRVSTQASPRVTGESRPMRFIPDADVPIVDVDRRSQWPGMRSTLSLTRSRFAAPEVPIRPCAFVKGGLVARQRRPPSRSRAPSDSCRRSPSRFEGAAAGPGHGRHSMPCRGSRSRVRPILIRLLDRPGPATTAARPRQAPLLF
jgi:hypothetical protein